VYGHCGHVSRTLRGGLVGRRPSGEGDRDIYRGMRRVVIFQSRFDVHFGRVDRGQGEVSWLVVFGAC
jgi:hypothetical protein